MKAVKPKKNLGQHFLTDLNIAKRIADTASGVGTIAGSYVLDGKVQRGCRCRVYRGDDMIFEGDLASLKRFKDDVKEVAAGYECGLVFSNFNDIQMEDRVECYIMVEVPR